MLVNRCTVIGLASEFVCCFFFRQRENQIFLLRDGEISTLNNNRRCYARRNDNNIKANAFQGERFN